MATTTGTDIIPAIAAKTLTGLILERVRRSAERVAYIHCDPASGRWIELSWKRMAELAGRWQAALSREGLSPGDRAALQMGNRPEWVCFDMAALGLGLITVPLYTNDRPENILHILQDAGVRLLLLERGEQLEALAPLLARLDRLDRILMLEPSAGEAGGVDYTRVAAWLAGAQGQLVDLVESPDTPATIVYTSGTMGAPKGVTLSHRNILWNAEAVLSVIPGFPEDRFLSFLPLSHTLERTGGYYLPMMAGASVTYARSIPQLAEDLQIVQPTVLIAVPRIFEKIHTKIQSQIAGRSAAAHQLFAAAVSVGRKRFEHTQGRRTWSPALLLGPIFDRLVGRKIREHLGGRLRVAVSGGAPLSPHIAHFFIGLGIPLVQGYGLTEAGPVVSLSPLEDNLPESVGVPLPGVEVRIGSGDELLVKSPGVMLGYWNRRQDTAAVIDSSAWLRTGDQARMVGEHIFITGRTKEVIVLANGEKVAPAVLETAIGMDGLFAQVLILGEGRPYPAALVVLDPDSYARLATGEGLNPDPEAERLNPRLEEILLERVDKRLAVFPGHVKIPRLAVVKGPWTLNDGLLTPTLKLKRFRILEKHDQEVKRLYEGHV